MIEREWVRTLRTHTGYASATLCGVLVLFEFVLPGSVLPYIPLFPLCVARFILLVGMPKRETRFMNRAFLITALTLIFAFISLTLRDNNGISNMILILAILIILILAAIVLYPRD